jgi:hypothetical protein
MTLTLLQVELYDNRLRVLSPLGVPYVCDESLLHDIRLMLLLLRRDFRNDCSATHIFYLSFNRFHDDILNLMNWAILICTSRTCTYHPIHAQTRESLPFK